jgi:hypothetical protein
MEVRAERLSPADPNEEAKEEYLQGYLQAACLLQRFAAVVDPKLPTDSQRGPRAIIASNSSLRSG